MLVIYDNNGTIVTADTKKENIVGSLYSMEITIPAGKVLSKIDTSNVTHVPVFVYAPKSPQEYTNEQIQKLMPQLARNDMAHDEAIENINSVLDAIKSKVGQLEADVTVLKKGAE